MSQAENAAIALIEVTDANSLAASLEQGWNEQDTAEPAEVEQEEVEETTDISPDEEEEAGEVETDTSDEDTEEDLEESEDQEAEAEDSETPQFQTLAEIAEAIDMPLDEFMENIKATRKIDGVEEEVTLAELRNANQRDADYRRKTTAHADNVRAWDTEQAEQKAQLGQQYQEAAAITANLEQQLMGEFNNVDWDGLEREDREEWLVQRQKFGERAQQIETVKTQVGQQLNEQQQELQAKQEAQQNQYLAEQGKLLLDAIPEYADTAYRETSDKEMTAFLGDYGFSAAEVGNVIDHRLVKLAFDAMKNKGKTSKVDATKKLVRKLPKILKPANKPDKVVLRKKQQQDKRKKFAKKSRHSTTELADFFAS